MLTEERNTPEVAGELASFYVAVETKIFAGGLVALDSDGYAVPMSTATGLKAVGRAEATADNSTGLAGAKSVVVKPGIFRWANSADADLITRPDLYADCYGVDDQTVAKTSGTGTRSVAGKIVAVDATGVWVMTRP